MRRPFALLAAESLALPVGVALAVVLARELGPEEFGLMALAVSLVTWTESALLALFGRAAVRVLAQGEGVEGALLRQTRRAGWLAWLALALLAVPAALLSGRHRLLVALPLLALEVPLLLGANLHKCILVARRRDGARALATAARWLARLVLVLALCPLGVPGVLLGMVLAAGLELLVASRATRSRGDRSALDLRPVLRYLAPWVAATGALGLVETMGVWAVASLPAASGWYGAAQGATRAGYVVLTLLPVLHAEIACHPRASGRLIRRTLAGLLLSLPVAALVAHWAGVLMPLLYGPGFAPAAELLTWLVFAGCGYIMLDTIHTLLGASGRARLTLGLTAPLPLIALAGHLALVPARGAVGAASVTALSLLAGALAGYLVTLGTAPGRGPRDAAIPPASP